MQDNKNESFSNDKRNLYDLSNEELKEKLDEEFNKYYNIKAYYNDENWVKLNLIKEEFDNKILETTFALSLYNETRYQLSKVEKIKKEPSKAEIVLDSIMNTLTIIGKGIATIYNSIKFAFVIFALSVASIIITIFLHLILGTFIYAILPRGVTPLMLQSIIAAILFIAFNVMIFIDKDDKDVLNNSKMEIFKYSCTIPFYASVFLIFTLMDKFPVLEEAFPLFYPHMWLSSFTNEFVISPMISLLVNCVISIIIYLIIKKKTDF